MSYVRGAVHHLTKDVLLTDKVEEKVFVLLMWASWLAGGGGADRVTGRPQQSTPHQVCCYQGIQSETSLLMRQAAGSSPLLRA